MDAVTARYNPPETEIELIRAWLRRARESQMQHYDLANHLSGYDKLFGVPVIVLTTLVSAEVFTSAVELEIPAVAKLIVGFLGLAAVFLSSLQTFFKFSERAEKHKVAAARYGAVRRKLEELYAKKNGQGLSEQISYLREELDRLAQESPEVPTGVYKKIQKNDFSVQADVVDAGRS